MCSRRTRMRFKKGSKVEVLGKKDVPCGSWYSAEIIHGNGHYYTVKYDKEEVFQRVPRKAIRPFPPVLQTVEDWVSGDVVEVFHGFSWKMANVLRVMPKDILFVRLTGCSEEVEVGKGDTRPRLCWQHDEWQVIGKGSGKQVITSLKLKCNYNSQQTAKNSTIATQSKKRRLTNGKEKRVKQIKSTNNRLSGSYNRCSVYDDCSIASSVASCSMSRKNVCERFGVDEYDSDAESWCGMRPDSEKGNCLLPQDDKLTDEIHRVELQAYRTTITAFHASGPLTWEQQTLLTNLRNSLHITNDEHLRELKNLVSPSNCINNT